MSVTDLLIGFGETSLAVAALIALVLIIRRPFARFFGARAAYALWLAPLIRLFLPELNVLPAPVREEFVFVTTELLSAASAGAVNPSIDWIGIAAATALFLWVAVAIALIAMRLDDQRRILRDATFNSIPAGRMLHHEAAAVAKELGLRRPPAIRIFGDESGPMVMGVFRPIVFLPASFETAFSAAERRLAYAHEFAHIARGDLFASFAAAILQAAQWPNPLAFLAGKAFRTDQEAACDAYVLARCGGDAAAKDYASAIMKSVRGGTPAIGLSLGHPLKERLMLMKNSTPSLARRLLGGIGAAALITVGLAASANYGYADDDVDVDAEVDVDTKVVTEKRVLVFTGVEDEIIFDDVVVGDRVRVMQFDDGDGEHRIIRIDGDNLEHDFDVVKVPHDGISWSSTGCVAGDGEGEPVMLEFKEESGEGEHKSAYHTVICLTGEDAKPENRAAALEKAITDLETRAKEEEARRKKMIQSLRKQAKELEKKK